MQGFEDQTFLNITVDKKFLFFIKNGWFKKNLFLDLRTPIKDVQATREAFGSQKREHPAFQNMIF